MKNRTFAFVALATLLMGAVLAATPSTGQADVVITGITVSDVPAGGTYTYTGSTSAGGTWNFGPTGITLTQGQSLVLTQNQLNQASTAASGGQPGFNFDTSEGNSTAAAKQYTVTVNGGTGIADTSGNLNVSGNDNPSSTTLNESANWVKIGGVAGKYDVYVGYADTLHSNPCLDGGNCLPFFAGNNIWDGSGGSTAATFFLGHASTMPDYTGATSNCNFKADPSAPATWNCYDAGAILIVNTEVPEPSTVLLVGTLILGLVGMSIRRARKVSVPAVA